MTYNLFIGDSISSPIISLHLFSELCFINRLTNKMYNLKNEAIMYIENDDFSVWMQKLYAKLEELCKDVRVLRNADRVLPEDDNLLDNQDLCLLFKVSIKTLQRYRAIGALPYFTISGKVYYKASDVREFIKERFSVTTLRQFEKEHCTKKKK